MKMKNVDGMGFSLILKSLSLDLWLAGVFMPISPVSR